MFANALEHDAPLARRMVAREAPAGMPIRVLSVSYTHLTLPTKA